MIIGNDFYLSGFTRQDKGEAGAVFVHYEEVQEDKRAPEIKEVALYYGGADTANFTVSIPKPKAKKITACAIVTRTSKNCYQATVYDETRIEMLRKDSLDGLRAVVAEFFQNSKKNVSRAR